MPPAVPPAVPPVPVPPVPVPPVPVLPAVLPAVPPVVLPAVPPVPVPPVPVLAVEDYPFPPVVPVAPALLKIPPPVPPVPAIPGQPVLIIRPVLGAGTALALAGALTNELLLALLQVCETFEELFWLRQITAHLNRIYKLNSSSLLTLVASRVLRDSWGSAISEATVEMAKEILIYQRYTVNGVIPRSGYLALRKLIYNREVTANRTNLRLLATDIPQFKENIFFCQRFLEFYQTQLYHSTYQSPPGFMNVYARLQDESQIDFDMIPFIRHNPEEESIEFEVNLPHFRIEDFYRAWLLTYRFKYESITTFARRGPSPLTPEHLGRVHQIAFIMDQFWLSQIPFNRTSCARGQAPHPIRRTEAIHRRSRILIGWRKRCFMGVWYPLKRTKRGFFSLNLTNAVWRKTTLPDNSVVYAHFRRGFLGTFTMVNGGGHLIYWKLLAHLAQTTYRNAPLVDRENGDWEDELLRLKLLFDVDFSLMQTLALANKYNLLNIV